MIVPCSLIGERFHLSVATKKSMPLIEKALNSVSREYIINTLRLAAKWNNWIWKCIFKLTFSVSMSDSPSRYFSSFGGIR